jgi:hypothetical protein
MRSYQVKGMILWDLTMQFFDLATLKIQNIGVPDVLLLVTEPLIVLVNTSRTFKLRCSLIKSSHCEKNLRKCFIIYNYSHPQEKSLMFHYLFFYSFALLFRRKNQIVQEGGTYEFPRSLESLQHNSVKILSGSSLN